MNKTITSYFIALVTLSFYSFSQNLNQEIRQAGKEPYLVGEIKKSVLKTNPYQAWFVKNYESYEVELGIIDKIAKDLKKYKIRLFMGAWCGDSRRNVPKFLKILDACHFPEQQLKIITVDKTEENYKKSPGGEEKGLNIHRVPTFIFYLNGKEVNRIVEDPVISFEQDILDVISGQEYQSNYQIVTHLNSILNNEGRQGLKRQNDKIIKTFKGKVSSIYELNTYAKILLTNHKIEQSIEVLKLNIELFPKDTRVYYRLLNVLFKYDKKREAKQLMKKAVNIFPKEDVFKTKLKDLEKLKLSN